MVRPRSGKECVRLYYRFPLSHRSIEELLFERGVIVSYESIRRWRPKFGPLLAAELRRRRPQPKGTWHLDEVYIKMNSKTFYLWRAVDADGMVLADIAYRAGATAPSSSGVSRPGTT